MVHIRFYFIRKEFLLCPNFAVCTLSFQYSDDFIVLGFKYYSNIFVVNLKFSFVVFGISFIRKTFWTVDNICYYQIYQVVCIAELFLWQFINPQKIHLLHFLYLWCREEPRVLILDSGFIQPLLLTKLLVSFATEFLTLNFLCFYFKYIYVFACMCVWALCACPIPMETRRGCCVPRTGVTDGFEPPDGCWENTWVL